MPLGGEVGNIAMVQYEDRARRVKEVITLFNSSGNCNTVVIGD